MKRIVVLGLLCVAALVHAGQQPKVFKNVTIRALQDGKHWFHHNGDGEKVQKKINKALEYFDAKKVLPHKKSIIIIDVDNTALCIGKWQHAITMPFRMLPAIEQVHELYTELVQRGYKIVFLSSRIVPGWKFTRDNLIKAGYKDFELLINRGFDSPSFQRGDLKRSIGVYKQLARDRLRAQGYVIIGSIGNSPTDFDNKTGYKIELPCYKGTVA